jgi:hypothetical protein
LQQFPTDAGHGAGQVLQASFQLSQDFLPAEGFRRDLQARKHFVEMPAQPALDARPLCDEVVSVVDQQPQLSCFPI